MTTPQGGSPDEKPDATGGRAPDPDPDVTSFAAPPQDPPPSWPAAAPPSGPAPAQSPAQPRGWSEKGAPADAPAPADPTTADPTTAWAPPATPPADETRVGWAAPPPDPRGGFAGPGGRPGWGPPGSAPPGSPASWAPAAETTWAPGPPGGWASPDRPGWAQQQPPAGWAPPHPGWGPPPGSWNGPQQPWGAPPPGWAPPPPPPRRGKLVALIAVGVLLLAALGVGGYLLVRDTSTGPVAVPAGFRPVTTSTLSYAVPPGWTDSPNALSVLGAPFEGRADAPGYSCDDAGYFRGVAASAFVPGERPAAAVAGAFARETGRVFYLAANGAVPDVRLSEARPVDVDGVQGQLVEATASTPADDGCLATNGVILLLAVPTTGPDGAPGTAVLVVNGDTAGGPATAPPLVERTVLDAVLGSARLPSI